MINYGEHFGKLVVILDVVDQNFALVDGLEQFPRQKLSFKRMSITNLKLST